MARPVFLRCVGAVVALLALLGVGCLLFAPFLPWVHYDPDLAHRLAGFSPDDNDPLLLVLRRVYIAGWSPAPALCILYLLPFLGSCLVAVAGLRAWQGSTATRADIARLLLGMSCALLGLADIPGLVDLAAAPGDLGRLVLHTAGPGARLASLGFVMALAGGALLAVGALLHRWTLRHNARRASTTTTG